MERKGNPEPPEGGRDLVERVLDTVAVALDVPREGLSLDSRIEQDLQADSLDVLSLVMALEDEFAGTVDRAHIGRFQTLADIVRYIEEQGLAARPGL